MSKLLDDIKRDAVRSGTKIQTNEQSEFETKLNELFYLEKKPDEELEFLKSVMTRGQETAERKGLHCSAIIVSDKKFCIRQQVLSLFYKQRQGEQTSVGLKRIFSEGDAIHEKWQRLFIRGNYVKPLDCDYTLFDKEYDLTYTPDLNHVMIDGIEYVGEIKSVNTYAFKKQTQHVSGRKQLQMYMWLTGIHNGFVLCEDKNTQDIKVYPYKFDISEIKPYIARLEQIQYHKSVFVEKRKMVKRHEKCTSSNCDMAESCPMRDACYNIGMGRVRL